MSFITPSKGHILLCEDDPQSRKSTKKILQLENYEVSEFENPEEALKFLAAQRSGDLSPHGPVQVIVSDIRMPKMTGLEFVKALSTVGDATPVILMTAYGSVDDAVWAMKWGVIDFLTKPFKRVDLLEAVDIALKRSARGKVSAALATSIASANERSKSDASDWIGRSEIFLNLQDHIRQVAPTQATVLITGESGSGKERVAREVHAQSARAKGPFIALNCAALPENLLESELFGFERGAFTGADQMRVGLFEAANGGTLFLDEIGEMAMALQSKLLRVLSDGEVRKIGSSVSKKVSVRLVTATHRNLREKVVEGTFRADLLYRLEVVHLHVPSLRERPEDLPELALHFIREFSLKHEKKVYGISEEALALLLRHPFPGNIRELQNAIERAVVFAKRDEIEPGDLPEAIRRSAEDAEHFSPAPGSSHISIRVGTPLKDVEDLLIRKTLEHSRGDKNLTAKLLGINSRTIYRKLQEKEGDPET